MNFTTDYINNVLPNSVELEIIKSINTNPPECYDNLTINEIDNLTDKFISNPEYSKYNINIEQIRSIRFGYITNQMIITHYKLTKNVKKIIKDYNKNLSVLELSKKYNGSPLNILRVIFKQIYSKQKAKNFFKHPNLLKPKDYEQFKLAKRHDAFALVNQDEVAEKANLFEEAIANVLDIHNILYSTQAELVEEQTKIYGKPINTPDFLIKTPIKINGFEVNWIDAKNFYGANVKFIKDSLIDQTKKYIDTYGPGCVVYKLGFNDEFAIGKILFLSYNAFKTMTRTN